MSDDEGLPELMAAIPLSAARTDHYASVVLGDLVNSSCAIDMSIREHERRIPFIVHELPRMTTDQERTSMPSRGERPRELSERRLACRAVRVGLLVMGARFRFDRGQPCPKG